MAKESIFTGLNNLQVLSITDNQYDEYFGFSDEEVKNMLDYYHSADKYSLVKEWYDGYHFGRADVYCPWDVVNYCSQLRVEPNVLPKAFWVNTSGNDIIRIFLRMATPKTKRELEQLVEGQCIIKKINQELTYRELYQNIDNFWSMLFTAGYLTQDRSAVQCTDLNQNRMLNENTYYLTIPNLEIRKIFIEQIYTWFQEEVRKDTPMLDAFCSAFVKTDAKAAETLFNAYLQKTISIRDTGVRKQKKENFYHGILLGLLSHREDWNIDSNAESGDGCSDILIEVENKGIGIVIEVKYSDSSSLEAGCKEALNQIKTMNYAEKLRQDGMSEIYQYGIACRKKECRIECDIFPSL